MNTARNLGTSQETHVGPSQKNLEKTRRRSLRLVPNMLQEDPATPSENGVRNYSYRYSSYGKTTIEKDNGSTDHNFVENLFAYTGREYDIDTELYGYRSRYYSPELGRFISRDKIWPKGGLNGYDYASENPLSFVDPEGSSQLPSGGGTGKPESIIPNATVCKAIAMCVAARQVGTAACGATIISSPELAPLSPYCAGVGTAAMFACGIIVINLTN